jgi:preprotein translocase subunit SecG
MTGLIIGVIIVVAVLLILVVLAQNPKSSGSAGGLAFSGANQLMGAKRSADAFEKLTWGFAITIMVLALTANIVIEKPEASEGFSSPNVEAAKEKSILPTTTDSTSTSAPIITTDSAK